MKTLIILVFLNTIISCTKKHEDKLTNNDGSAPNEQGTTQEENFVVNTKDKSSDAKDSTNNVLDLVHKEEFNEFFEQFKSDSIFQVSRIEFPLFRLLPDYVGDGYINEHIPINEWKYYDFFYDSTFLTRQYDKYTQELKVYGDSAKILIHGINNGIYVDFIFKLVDGKWILIRMDDLNN